MISLFFLIGTAMSDDGVISTNPLTLSDVLLSHIYIFPNYILIMAPHAKETARKLRRSFEKQYKQPLSICPANRRKRNPCIEPVSLGR